MKSVYTMEEGWYQQKHTPLLQKLQGIFFAVLFGISGKSKSVFTVGLVLIVWSGQIVNPIIAIVDPVLYCSIRVCLYKFLWIY